MRGLPMTGPRGRSPSLHSVQSAHHHQQQQQQQQRSTTTRFSGGRLPGTDASMGGPMGSMGGPAGGPMGSGAMGSMGRPMGGPAPMGSVGSPVGSMGGMPRMASGKTTSLNTSLQSTGSVVNTGRPQLPSMPRAMPSPGLPSRPGPLNPHANTSGANLGLRAPPAAPFETVRVLPQPGIEQAPTATAAPTGTTQQPSMRGLPMTGPRGRSPSLHSVQSAHHHQQQQQQQQRSTTTRFSGGRLPGTDASMGGPMGSMGGPAGGPMGSGAMGSMGRPMGGPAPMGSVGSPVGSMGGMPRMASGKTTSLNTSLQSTGSVVNTGRPQLPSMPRAMPSPGLPSRPGPLNPHANTSGANVHRPAPLDAHHHSSRP
ncbi:MAG: hypothetical protein MHM6MM_009344, partial [Cercozoa sp. M6MM]